MATVPPPIITEAIKDAGGCSLSLAEIAERVGLEPRDARLIRGMVRALDQRHIQLERPTGRYLPGPGGE